MDYVTKNFIFCLCTIILHVSCYFAKNCAGHNCFHHIVPTMVILYCRNQLVSPEQYRQELNLLGQNFCYTVENRFYLTIAVPFRCLLVYSVLTMDGFCSIQSRTHPKLTTRYLLYHYYILLSNMVISYTSDFQAFAIYLGSISRYRGVDGWSRSEFISHRLPDDEVR